MMPRKLFLEKYAKRREKIRAFAQQPGITFADVGRKFGITGERVRQLCKPKEKQKVAARESSNG